MSIAWVCLVEAKDLRDGFFIKLAAMKINSLLWLAIVLLASCGGGSNESGSTAPDKRVAPEDDSVFLDVLQKAHFNYMWEGAEPHSGMAPERIHLDGIYPENDQHIVTTGGSGFGVAGLVAAADRGFITRSQAVERLRKIVGFLGRADRFHGVWPHWLDGTTGRVKPFSPKDDGADLVESSFLMQGLLIAREYFKNGNADEKALAEDIDALWRDMEYDWFQKDGQPVLYWHWSPDCAWEMNFPLEGYNETMITYILGASSPTHPIQPDAYHKGWARSGAIKSDAQFQGLPLVLKHNGAETTGGPLFWAHYSWIGLNPRGLKDQYADYWQMTRNHVLSDYRYCVANPRGYSEYGENCWGLTASYSPAGYSAHSPGNDLGVITPTAALSSFPYTPEESMCAARHFYERSPNIWGKYGFYDAFSPVDGWTLPRYLAIDQLTIAPMIENYRTGLLWRLFMGAPEIQKGLQRLEFEVKK